MKQVFLFLTVITFCIRLQAQQGYLITIDADDNQPFSVILGKSNYNSSSVGHLVLSNLKDSTYQLTIRFPKSVYADHFFTVDINKKDRGFQLKKNTEKVWSMQDLQTMALIRADRVEQGNSFTDQQHSSGKSKDAFALMMAAVVNDSAVLFTTPHKTESVKKSDEDKKDKQSTTENEKQTGIAVNDKKADSLILIPPTPKKTLDDSLLKADNKTVVSKEIKNGTEKAKQTDAAVSTTTKPANDPLKKAAVPVVVKKDAKGKTVTPKPGNQKNTDSTSMAKKADTVSKKNAPKSIIIKLNERWTKEAREMVFIDTKDGITTDTIKILIELTAAEDKNPALDTTEKKPIIVAAAADKTEKKTIPDSETVVTKKQDSVSVPVTSIKSHDTVIAKKSDTTTAKKSVKADTVKKAVIINSDCKNFAAEADVDKLRIKLIAENDQYERIVIARKVFRTKCFTAKQIKALTELFVSDKARYGFFDAAYPFVSDTENFKQLVELLTDDYYINRFKMLVRMQ